MRILTNTSGFAILPDFLCQSAIESGKMQILWEGRTPLINTLYFATKKQNSKQTLLHTIIEAVSKVMPPTVPVED